MFKVYKQVSNSREMQLVQEFDDEALALDSAQSTSSGQQVYVCVELSTGASSRVIAAFGEIAQPQA